MATTSAQQYRWAYDAFVSFRGEDIRKSFMDHLFKDFEQKRIHAFRDDKDLTLGENISPNLDKVIQESRFLIIIFSKNYASSSWCLRELVKILECKQMGEHKHEVRIIFYDVKPDVVRKQTGSYAEAFTKHEISNRNEVAKWKEALSMAADLSGWDLQDMANGYESKFMASISEEILKALFHESLHVGENLVGVDARIKKMNLFRFVHSNKVHMIGICGIGGIGKTTFAKAIYNLMYSHFEECIFLDDVQGATKRHGLTHVVMELVKDIMKTTDVRISNIGQGIMVMKQRMASKRILLVVDDVDHRDQLEALVGSSDWFFPGTLIVFTSKDKQLLRSHKVDEIYDMEFLDYAESLELFGLYAFHKEHPTEDFEELAKHVVQYVKGHPLALKVLGSFLYGKTLQEWKSELESLQVYPNEEIHRVLRLSFDALSSVQKHIFLDIACSFIGENKDFAVTILDGCNYFADTNIKVLVDKSLLSVSHGGLLEMHDLIQIMAREIVREESILLPGKRSRLWISSEVYDVLIENTGTEEVEVIHLSREECCLKIHIDCKAFAHMKNLRILKICDEELTNVWHDFDLKLWNESKVNYHGKLKFLSNKLRLLYWHGFPFKCFPSDFYPENIVAIDLSYSNIKNLWTSPKCFRRLKVMKLKHCRNLTSTPDFTMSTDLSELILEGCVNLVKVHPSFGMLKMLVVLNMKDCRRFRRFPCNVKMDSLEVLNLSGCSKLDKLPEFFDEIQTLKEFSFDGTAITELPSFVFSQRNLQVLSGCGRCEQKRSRWWTSISPPSLASKMQHPQILVIPSLVDLCFLRTLNLSFCNIVEVSESIGGLSCLEYLSLVGNNFTSLPGCLTELSHLKSLDLFWCKKLEVLPEIPPSLCDLSASHCSSLYQLPPNINNNTLSDMSFSGCPKLFRNLSQVCMSQPLPDINSSIASHSCSNQISSVLRLMESMKLPSNTCGIFGRQGTQFYRNISSYDIIYHGNRIPQWFTNQSTGNDIQVELPPNFCYNKLRGYGICVVLTPKKSYGRKIGHHKLRYYVENFDGTCVYRHYGSFRDSIGTPKSDIIWFHFMTTCQFGWFVAKNFVTFSLRDDDDNDVEVKEYGVRLVFDEDINEEMDFSITRDIPTPTQDGAQITIWKNSRHFAWSW